MFAHDWDMHSNDQFAQIYTSIFSFLLIPHCTLCVVSEQLTDMLENVEAFPGETVTEVTGIPETGITKEEKVEIETDDTTVPPKISG